MRSLLVLFLSLASFNLFAQDVSITNVIVSNPSISGGANITIGTALNEISFDVTNTGSTTIAAGTTLNIDLQIGSGPVSGLGGSFGANLTVGNSTTFTINCTSAGINEDFPSTTGQFSICIDNTSSWDINSSNDRDCETYTMVSSSTPDIGVDPGTIRLTGPNVAPGGSISLGTSADSMEFYIENFGNTTITQGTSLPIDFEWAGSAPRQLFGSAYQAIAPGGSLRFTINLTPSGINESFPTTSGMFDICVTTKLTTDGNSSNDNDCSIYFMGSGSQPQVTGYNPTSGPIGTTVTITGNNFPTSGNTVRFNGITASISSNTSSQIVTSVPSGATDGNIMVDFGSGFVTVGFFDVTTGGNPNHTISSINPTSGTQGDLIVITGTNFSTTPSDHTVYFNGSSPADVKNSTATSLQVEVPHDATTGKIEVILSGNSAFSPVDFTMNVGPTPFITAFNPTQGAVGQNIQILGGNFNTDATKNYVVFDGGASTTGTAGNDTAIVVTVPNGAVTGPVSVSSQGATGTSGTSFVILDGPVISDFTPKSGPTGTNVVIDGFNFSPVGSNNDVTFGSVTAGTPVSQPDGRKLVVTVPVALSPGFHNVSVTVAGQTATSSSLFHVDAVGVGEFVEDSYFKANYVSGSIRLAVKSSDSFEDVSLEVYDMKGSRIGKELIQHDNSNLLESSVEIDLPAGHYSIVLSDERGNIWTSRLAVQ